MRRYLATTLLLLVVALVALPTALGRMAGKAAPPTAHDPSDTLTVKIYFPQTQTVQAMALGEYLKGVVAAEMPPEFEMEALKSQLVVARTYTVRRMQQFVGPGKGGCPLNAAADVCADPATGQAYISRADLTKRLGTFAAMSLWKRLNQAEAETAGLVLTYRGELIDPLYHSVSGTVTEDAAEYFGQSLPYLKPVDDHWGADAPKLRETRTFNPEALASAFRQNGPGVVVPAAAAKGQSAAQAPVQIVSRTATGRVKSVKVGANTVSGREFRERLGLRSTDFTVTMRGGQVLISTHGYGHGVGMSQYGANGMARAGKGFRDILTHYYTGVSVGRIFSE